MGGCGDQVAEGLGHGVQGTLGTGGNWEDVGSQEFCLQHLIFKVVSLLFQPWGYLLK